MISITAHGMAKATTELLSALPVSPTRGNASNATLGITARRSIVLMTIAAETVGR